LLLLLLPLLLVVQVAVQLVCLVSVLQCVQPVRQAE
jgi:hypothetical protein